VARAQPDSLRTPSIAKASLGRGLARQLEVLT
jgi:hypothetical protein